MTIHRKQFTRDIFPYQPFFHENTADMEKKRNETNNIRKKKEYSVAESRVMTKIYIKKSHHDHPFKRINQGYFPLSPLFTRILQTRKRKQMQTTTYGKKRKKEKRKSIQSLTFHISWNDAAGKSHVEAGNPIN